MKTISETMARSIARKVKLLLRRGNKTYIGGFGNIQNSSISFFQYICSKEIPKNFEEIEDFDMKFVEEKRKKDFKILFDKNLYLEDVIAQLPITVQDSIDVIEICAGACTKTDNGVHYEYVRIYRKKTHPLCNNLTLEEIKDIYKDIPVYVRLNDKVYSLSKNITDHDFMSKGIEQLCEESGKALEGKFPCYYVDEEFLCLNHFVAYPAYEEKKILHGISYLQSSDEEVRGISLMNLFLQIPLVEFKSPNFSRPHYIFIDSPLNYIDLNCHTYLREASDGYAVYSYKISNSVL